MDTLKSSRPRWGILVVAGLLVGLSIWVGNIFLAPVAAPPEVNGAHLHPLVREAIEKATLEVQEQPRSGEKWGELGMVLMAHDLPQPAAACYQQASHLAPTDFRWPYLLGYMAEEEDFYAALPYYQQALALSPQSVPVRLRVAMTHLRLAQMEECQAVLAEGEAQYPRDPYLLVTAGRVALLAGDLVGAQERFERAVAQPRWSPQPALLELVKLSMRQGKLVEATGYRTRLLQLPTVSSMDFPDPVIDRVRMLEGLAKVLAERADFAKARGDTRLAISLYEAFVKKRPDMPTALTNLAEAYAMNGDWPEAISRYQEVLNRFGEQVNVRYGLASTYLQSGDVDQAIVEYGKVIEHKSDHKQAWFQLGLIHDQRGNVQRAEECYRQVVEIDPSFPQGQLALGILLLNQGKPEEAKLYIQRATDLAPQDELPRTYLERTIKALEGAN